MPSIIKSLTALAIFATGIDAQKRAFLSNLDALDASSDRIPPTVGFSISTWAKGSYPQFCYDQARTLRGNGQVNCAIGNLEVYTVTYNDCPTRPWTLCRCSDSNLSRQKYAEDFGRVPPGIRSRVVHALSVQDSGTSAGSGNDRILFRGNVKPAVHVHEAMHSVDQGFSRSTTFTNAYNQDSCVPDDYANASPAEDFAQLGVWIQYDTNPSTKLRSYVGDFSCMGHQLEQVGIYAGEQLNKATSKCFDRRPNDANVSVAFAKGTGKIKASEVETLPATPLEFEDVWE
ncbi:hypothetical protein BU24DRAFT_419973 [Aaosphaeria arxii CBS 175.79]|uniref:Uncharacterized protein n=1 Tax=Aaosphaeria arxii CBS 175.79 TaxID=1450172 RepID=A0A6A5XXC5_9PLEO|nr:uncharacterized protein BU24DRAFT_419973 [Aaosphaeria arxii CBS 175.79]KAF2016924.1 hypothetical protein BU24DRAFT_419973 [Aaosphaeria arxii CBS 175.79]